MISTVVCDKNLDSQLWASFQKGESKALDTLYKRYYSSLLAYGYHYCGERELAADCIHDFFLTSGSAGKAWGRFIRFGST
ncbi:MAG: sigma-70 family RNA polymerase sigma factor [Bacteroidia bacterium]|nr:sigma-70 family RNA polymerase sigma factor [Bacteroidia bacterium]